MDWENIVNLICAVLAGAATALPLVFKLAEYITAAAREKNWKKLLELVMALMADAEQMFGSGAEKKEYVLSALDNLSGVVDYDMDREDMELMIDKLCAMSKRVNIP